MGKLDEAIGYYQRALALKPDDPGIRQQLERAQAAKAKNGAGRGN